MAELRALLTHRPGQVPGPAVVPYRGRALQVREDRVLVVDLQDHRARTAQPRRHHIVLAVTGVLYTEPRPRDPLHPPPTHLLLDAGLPTQICQVEHRHTGGATTDPPRDRGQLEAAAAEPTRITAITINARLRKVYLRALTAAAVLVSNRRRRDVPDATVGGASWSSSSSSKPQVSSTYSYSYSYSTGSASVELR